MLQSGEHEAEIKIEIRFRGGAEPGADVRRC
jgi:hypothetical protein